MVDSLTTVKSCLGVEDEPFTLLPVCRSRELEILQVYGVKRTSRKIWQKNWGWRRFKFWSFQKIGYRLPWWGLKSPAPLSKHVRSNGFWPKTCTCGNTSKHPSIWGSTSRRITQDLREIQASSHWILHTWAKSGPKSEWKCQVDLLVFMDLLEQEDYIIYYTFAISILCILIWLYNILYTVYMSRCILVHVEPFVQRTSLQLSVYINMHSNWRPLKKYCLVSSLSSPLNQQVMPESPNTPCNQRINNVLPALLASSSVAVSCPSQSQRAPELGMYRDQLDLQARNLSNGVR